MPTAELFISLKVPDNVAITAFHTLERMGYNQLKKLERKEYCKFEFSGDKKSFERNISHVDILVNANKHKFSFSLDNSIKNNENKVNVLVQDLGDGSGLLKTLKERLGFKGIKKMEKGVLWTLYFGNIIDAEDIAVGITKSLLMNENYQKYRILE
ncbi:hypothetical protein HYU50_05545 [Candidatus Woesearchaeota archaeon]|nr:hypothetical protein [Candidatus Woesearchaeota archaeon]